MTPSKLTIVTFLACFAAACSDASFDVDTPTSDAAATTIESSPPDAPDAAVTPDADAPAPVPDTLLPADDTTPASPDTTTDAGPPHLDARPDAPKPDPTKGRPCESAFDCDAGRCCEIPTYGGSLITYCATIKCPTAPGKELP